ncbi:MAG TPA: hypothetical protein VL976_17760 [Xanthobacteraceae bacterium]|nr:hypothetical protein [Xanthobacteraceae bacterium]
MRSITLSLAALGLGAALVAGSAVAQDYYVGDQQAKPGQIPPKSSAADVGPRYSTGRTANDGGYLAAQQPKERTAQNQPTRERQNSCEGDDAAYGSHNQPGRYYNYSPGPGLGFGAPTAEPIAQGGMANCQARFRSFDPEAEPTWASTVRVIPARDVIA